MCYYIFILFYSFHCREKVRSPKNRGLEWHPEAIYILTAAKEQLLGTSYYYYYLHHNNNKNIIIAVISSFGNFDHHQPKEAEVWVVLVCRRVRSSRSGWSEASQRKPQFSQCIVPKQEGTTIEVCNPLPHWNNNNNSIANTSLGPTKKKTPSVEKQVHKINRVNRINRSLVEEFSVKRAPTKK